MRAKGRATKRKDGRWQTSVNLPSGQKRYLSGKTQTAVMRAAEKLRTAIEDGEAAPEDKRTVAEYLADWLDYTKERTKPSTYQRYEGLVRRQIVPGIGSTRLTRLRPDDLQRLYTDLLRGGLAPATVLHVHRVLFAALKQAERQDLVPRNVAAKVDAPRTEQYRGLTLTHDQALQLVSAVRGDELEALYVLAVTSGMRQGELLGLRWQDVDLDAGVLQVRGSLSIGADGKRRLSTTKTRSSERPVLLAPVAVQALRRHREAQRIRHVDGLVFTTPAGTSIEPSWLLRQQFYPLLERVGLPRIRFHDLRHTAVRLYLRNRLPVNNVAAAVGHASAKMTLDVYGHEIQPDDRQLRELLATLFPADE